jgi:hypothetical protein
VSEANLESGEELCKILMDNIRATFNGVFVIDCEPKLKEKPKGYPRFFVVKPSKGEDQLTFQVVHRTGCILLGGNVRSGKG